MASNWKREEIRAAARAYFWMFRGSQAGQEADLTTVIAALKSGPLHNRTRRSIWLIFRNISFFLRRNGRPDYESIPKSFGYRESIDPELHELLSEYDSGNKSAKRVSFLVSALPGATVAKAAADLAAGVPFSYPNSTTYDALTNDGRALSPKAVIGYAGLLHYGATLLPEDFSGGEGTPCFERLRAAGLMVFEKVAEPQSTEFREEVKKQKKKGLTAPPVGNTQPKKVAAITTTFVRDPAIVAFVEQRAKGHCERCRKPAPFLRMDGTPFLEVHHIDPLSEGGADTVENAAGLCPNCHRECHHGQRAYEIRAALHAKVAATK